MYNTKSNELEYVFLWHFLKIMCLHSAIYTEHNEKGEQLCFSELKFKPLTTGREERVSV